VDGTHQVGFASLKRYKIHYVGTFTFKTYDVRKLHKKIKRTDLF
jgi:hypothetical protein